ncbi:MAG: VanZ family protein [Ruminococcus sp.]|nr:VanZ family protein [Ruminococcus sp.]
MKIILFTVVFIIEVYLSQQNGRKSGAESRTLSEHLHLNEYLIRTGAHIGFFSILMFLALFLSKWLWVAAVLWAIIDEATKPLLKNERHFSFIDVGWNFVGVVIGTVVWMLTQWLETLVS